jgi:hypothetical protein
MKSTSTDDRSDDSDSNMIHEFSPLCNIIHEFSPLLTILV